MNESQDDEVARITEKVEVILNLDSLERHEAPEKLENMKEGGQLCQRKIQVGNDKNGSVFRQIAYVVPIQFQRSHDSALS